MKFEKAYVECVVLDNADVITTSGGATCTPTNTQLPSTGCSPVDF